MSLLLFELLPSGNPNSNPALTRGFVPVIVVMFRSQVRARVGAISFVNSRPNNQYHYKSRRLRHTAAFLSPPEGGQLIRGMPKRDRNIEKRKGGTLVISSLIDFDVRTRGVEKEPLRRARLTQ